MPWRLIGIIAVLAVLLGFIGFNLDNTCDLSLGFTVFSGVPVYLTVFVSFMLGLLCSLPFFVLGILKKSKKEKSSEKEKASGKNTAETPAPLPKSDDENTPSV